MRHRVLALTLAAAGMAVGGCFIIEPGFDDVPALEASRSPCFQANVLDGLSETDPAEMQALYACLNVHGGFEALNDIVAAMAVEPTREGRLAAFDLAAVVNRFAAEADVIAGVRQAVGLLQQENAFLLQVVHTLAEWVYGRPWPEVEAAFAVGGGDLLRADAITPGMVVPALRFASRVSRDLLDHGDPPLLAAHLGALAAMPELAQALDTLSRLVADQEEELFAHVAEDFGAWFQVSVSPSGDQTLLALVGALLAPQPALAGVSPVLAALPDADAILDDVSVRDELVAAVGELYVEGELPILPGQLSELLSLDAGGGFVGDGERSAFAALFRMIDLAHRPADCAFIHVDDLAVFILETVAGFNPDDLAGLISAVDGLVDDVVWLGTIACSGVDPALTEVVPALTRLAESGALRSMIPLLRALRDGGRVPEIVSILALFERGGVTPALSAHAARILDGPYVGNLLRITGAYVAPTDTAASGDLHTLLRIIDFGISPAPGDGYARSPLGALAPVLAATLAAEEPLIADLLQRWAVLLIADGSMSNQFLDKFAPLLAVDPELDFLGTLGSVLGDERVLLPTLRLLETTALVDAFVASPGPGGGEGPVGMLGRFAADGSLEGLLGILVWLADVLDEVGLLPEGD